MNHSILAALDAEIAKLQEARKLLAAPFKDNNGKPKRGGKRHLTPEGRARIAAAVKERWRRQKTGKAK